MFFQGGDLCECELIVLVILFLFFFLRVRIYGVEIWFPFFAYFSKFSTQSNTCCTIHLLASPTLAVLPDRAPSFVQRLSHVSPFVPGFL